MGELKLTPYNKLLVYIMRAEDKEVGTAHYFLHEIFGKTTNGFCYTQMKKMLQFGAFTNYKDSKIKSGKMQFIILNKKKLIEYVINNYSSDNEIDFKLNYAFMQFLKEGKYLGDFYVPDKKADQWELEYVRKD